MISVKHSGSFDKTIRFLNKMKKRDVKTLLNKCGKRGVDLLSKNTPVDSGKTASSWRYNIIESNGIYTVEFLNDNIQNGVNIAIILQYGHGTRNGGYVQGRDYINPAIQQAFDEMTDALWKEVVNA